MKMKVGGIAARVIIPVLLLAAVVVGISWYKTNIGDGGRESGYQYILDHFDSRGTFTDIRNDLAMKDPKVDIKFFMTEKEATIEFGNVSLIFEPRELVSREWQEKLERINITMEKQEKTGKLLLYYGGEEIERWVR